MNLNLLPKELQILIGEFNVEHRPLMRLVMNELIERNYHSFKYYSSCERCGDYSDEKYSIYLFWQKHKFCSEYCQLNGKEDIRRNKIRMDRYSKNIYT
jgi:RNA binding exosome subunit